MYTMDFLAWVQRCLFRDDFEKTLIELGVSEEIAFDLSRTDAVRHGKIVDLWQGMCLDAGEYRDAMVKFLDHQASFYKHILSDLKERGYLKDNPLEA